MKHHLISKRNSKLLFSIFGLAVALVLFAFSPTQAFAEVTYAKSPTVSNTSVTLSLISSYDEDATVFVQGGGDKKVVFTANRAVDVVFSGLTPGVTYSVYVNRNAIPPVRISGNLASFKTTVGTVETVDSFSYSKSPVVTNTTAGLSIIATKNNTNAIVRLVGPEGSSIEQAVSFQATQAKDVTFAGLTAGTTYEVAIKRANVALFPLGAFKTTGGTSSVPGGSTSGTGTISGTSTTAVGTKLLNEGTCSDGIDNNGDGRIDYNGYGDTQPDPVCLNPNSNESKDSVAAGSLVPCTDNCSFQDVFKLINNVINFVLTVLLAPIFVVMLMYTGYQYLTSRGNVNMHAKLKTRMIHLLGGLAIILCAWLLVKTFLSMLGVTTGNMFLG